MSTSTQTTHTPVPWDPYPKTSVRFVQLRLNDYRHAVHCVNAHDDLLAALENLENDDGSIPAHAWDLVQAAIAKVKETT